MTPLPNNTDDQLDKIILGLILVNPDVALVDEETKLAKQKINQLLVNERIDELRRADVRFTNPYLGKDKFQAYVRDRIKTLKENSGVSER